MAGSRLTVGAIKYPSSLAYKSLDITSSQTMSIAKNTTNAIPYSLKNCLLNITKD